MDAAMAIRLVSRLCIASHDAVQYGKVPSEHGMQSRCANRLRARSSRQIVAYCVGLLEASTVTGTFR
jgi:hypothetical protein